MHDRTLLLTPWYFPHRIVRWQDAVTMVFLGKAEVVVSYDAVLRSPSMAMPSPAVIRVRKLRRSNKPGVRFSRVNVYTRDDFRCQYCGERFDHRMLSYDHVTPRSAGGRTEWTNIVTACKPCNNSKGHLTCDEAGMWPLQRPVQPTSLPPIGPLVIPARAPREWRAFIPAAWASRI